jgi:hypothetical protein
MAGFWGYLGGAVIRPKRTFDRLVDDPRKVSLGFKAMLLVGFLYTATVAALAAAGALPAAPPFLRLAEENYYFYQIFFAMPVFFLGWIMAAGAVRLMARRGRESGTYEGALAALGFAFSVPFFITWAAETAFAVLLFLGMRQEEFMELSAQPGFWQYLILGYQFATGLWMLALASAAVAASQRTRWPRAILVGAAATVFFLAFIVVFVR